MVTPDVSELASAGHLGPETHAPADTSYMLGQRIMLMPHTDRYMRGDRYGTVVHVHTGGNVVRVELDRSGASLRFNVADICHSS